jgi:5'-methylthioadenosine phosphorylase
VTDYDAWNEGHVVDAAMVFETLAQNVAIAQDSVRELAKNLPTRDGCGCHRALDAALVTKPEAIDAEQRARLEPILARRLETTR